jgi:RpiB/LacA/LacB family sugar-phosphate isomerase
MIRQLGTHRGKQVIFGFDRYLMPELEDYTRVLSKYGIPSRAVNLENPYYLTSAQRVCERVRGRADAVGVLVCSTGMGMSIAANKFRGIYAARCMNVEDAQMARTINNANVVCLASRSSCAGNEAIIDAFMNTPYDGRKLEQLEYIACLELESDPPAIADVAVAAFGRARTRSA